MDNSEHHAIRVRLQRLSKTDESGDLREDSTEGTIFGGVEVGRGLLLWAESPRGPEYTRYVHTSKVVSIENLGTDCVRFTTKTGSVYELTRLAA